MGIECAPFAAGIGPVLVLDIGERILAAQGRKLSATPSNNCITNSSYCAISPFICLLNNNTKTDHWEGLGQSPLAKRIYYQYSSKTPPYSYIHWSHHPFLGSLDPGPIRHPAATPRVRLFENRWQATFPAPPSCGSQQYYQWPANLAAEGHSLDSLLPIDTVESRQFHPFWALCNQSLRCRKQVFGPFLW